MPLFNKHLDAGIHFLGGDGIGRYGTSTLQDVTVRPDGTLVPLRSYQALGTLELHATPKLDIYAYVGGEYLRRASYINPINGVVVGYGSNAFSNKGCNTETLPNSGNTALTSDQFVWRDSSSNENRSFTDGVQRFLARRARKLHGGH